MNIPPSVFLGPLFLAAFFVISAVIVAGTKLLIAYFRRTPAKTASRRKRVKKPAPPPAPAAPVRSIEINPDEVDKIYVRKVS